MNYRLLSMVAASSLLLSACGSTLEGIQRDFGNFATSIDEKVGDMKSSDNAAKPAEAPVTLAGDACPSIMVDPQLDSMSEFEDMENPSKETEISTVHLMSTKSECTLDGEFLTMRIDLSFDGQLGPKARRKNGDRPFFAYPYFIAVMDSEGNELARELFAASFTYTAEEDHMSVVDTIRQKLPLNDDGTVPAYQVQIGFQLTEDQLFYNSSL
ncbi:MAG TPA: hypothetical protein PLF01_04455 [Alphaproteobacteria bacterium]|nr:hypothetical protein [Alphaproteobacteria bacterium]